MKKAVWNGIVLAESDQTVNVEGNHYFPPDSVKWEYFQGSDTHTVCLWKGIASYHHIQVNGEVNEDGAWYYLIPLPPDRFKKESVKAGALFW
jgi:uncharacterized protein (DUF427 family)